MTTDGQQYGQDNFADDQQYGDYSEQNYGEDQYQQEGMEEGGDGGTQDGVNGSNLDVAPKSPSDEDRGGGLIPPSPFGNKLPKGRKWSLLLFFSEWVGESAWTAD